MKQALPVRSWANGPIREERKKKEEKKRKPYWPATAQLEGGKKLKKGMAWKPNKRGGGGR
jgi:hypothetical protein